MTKIFQVKLETRGEVLLRVEAEDERTAQMLAMLYYDDEKPTSDCSVLSTEHWVQKMEAKDWYGGRD